MMESFLVLVIVGGALFFNEPLTLGKFIGAAGFATAYLLINK